MGLRQGGWSLRSGALCLRGTLILSSPASHLPGIKTAVLGYLMSCLRVELGTQPKSSEPRMVFFLSHLVPTLFCFLKLLKTTQYLGIKVCLSAEEFGKTPEKSSPISSSLRAVEYIFF